MRQASLILKASVPQTPLSIKTTRSVSVTSLGTTILSIFRIQVPKERTSLVRAVGGLRSR